MTSNQQSHRGQPVLPPHPRHLVAAEGELGRGEVEGVDVAGARLQGVDHAVGAGQVLSRAVNQPSRNISVQRRNAKQMFNTTSPEKAPHN